MAKALVEGVRNLANENPQRILATFIAFLVSGLAFAIVSVLWWQTTGGLKVVSDPLAPPGQAFYQVSRLFGLYAYVALTLQISSALIRLHLFDCLSKSLAQYAHGITGILVMLCIVTHASAFAIGVSVRKGMMDWGLVVPKWNSGFYDFAVALGIVAMFCSVVIVSAGVLRHRGFRIAVPVHRTWAVLFALVTAHSYMIGSETRSLAMSLLYVLAIVVVLLLGLWRFGPSALRNAMQGWLR